MKPLYTIVAVLAAVALIGSIGATTLQHTVFGTRVDDTAKGHGDDVSRQALGDPLIVPPTAMGHGEDISDAAR